VVDLCCGVGISTRALRNAFPEAEAVMGIDTVCYRGFQTLNFALFSCLLTFLFFPQSAEMIEMAAFLSNHLSIVRPSFKRSTDQRKGMVCPTAASFSKANAENTELPSRSFDLVTIMYAFHEAPKQGREKILKEAHRLLQPGGTLAVIDICSEYQPSESMLAGEPYGTLYIFKDE
jgi:SAM-dependent methyltransferase